MMSGKGTGPQTCAAFPDGIPDAVFTNRKDHRQSVDGDHGIRWEPRGDLTYPEYALTGGEG